VDTLGYPWALIENKAANVQYEKGTCPVADDLFERSIIMSIPSCLTPQDELDIIRAFNKVAPQYRRDATVTGK